MTGRLRVIDTGLASGRWNTALSAALMHGACLLPDNVCLRFYRFEPCLLLGASEPYPMRPPAGIEIARRVTGGGTVYMSPSMLAWDVVLRQSAPPPSVSLACGEAVAAALRALGFATAAATPTGVMLAGRKVSGAAMGSDRGWLLYQGTLLIEDETVAMAQALGVAVDVMAPHVTSLQAHAALLPAMPLLQETVAAQVAAAFGRAAEPGHLTAHEQAVAEREYTREIGLESFVRGEDVTAARRAHA